MTIYADYTADEQQLLRSSLQAAAVAVSASSLGRKEETGSEGFAAASYILDGASAHVDNTLITSVIVELQRRLATGHPFPDFVAVASAQGARERALETLGELASLLETRAAPPEADGYKRWLLGIAQEVAAAGKEDQGFLGTGGVLVNDAERAALRQISDVLGVADAPTEVDGRPGDPR
jgi:hypothetical protein